MARTAARGVDDEGAPADAGEIAEEVGSELELEDAAATPWLFRDGRIAWVLTALGAVGLVASFSLTLEYLHKLQNPNDALLCDINLFMTCGPAMQSWAGSVLGFPNILIGLIAFTLTLTTGVAMLAGARFARWYWIGYQFGILGGIVLVTFLQWFSVFELSRLCLWCMIIWAATIPLFILTTTDNLVNGRLGSGAAQRAGRAIAGFAPTIVVVWYLALIGVIVAGMWNTIQLALAA